MANYIKEKIDLNPEGNVANYTTFHIFKVAEGIFFKQKKSVYGTDTKITFEIFKSQDEKLAGLNVVELPPIYTEGRLLLRNNEWQHSTLTYINIIPCGSNRCEYEMEKRNNTLSQEQYNEKYGNLPIFDVFLFKM